MTILTILEVILWTVLSLIGLLFALFFALILFGFTYSAYTNRRDLRFLSAFPCPKCDQALGRAPVLAAKARYEEKVQEVMKNRPAYLKCVAFRMADAIWEIECPHCCFKFLFHPSESRIEIPSASAQPA